MKSLICSIIIALSFIYLSYVLLTDRLSANYVVGVFLMTAAFTALAFSIIEYRKDKKERTAKKDETLPV